MNWFLKLIGVDSVVEEVQARADRQVQALQGEIDVIESRISITRSELLAQIGSVRGSLGVMIEQITDQITEPSPANNESTQMFQNLITNLVTSMDEQLVVLENRVKVLEEDEVTESVVGGRLEEEIDDNSVSITRIDAEVALIKEALARMGYDFQIHVNDYKALVSVYNAHVRRTGTPHTAGNHQKMVHTTYED